MYLKSLELHGFKSFPNKTVLTFERGATVIVGPNGSGKSNISDAMRWVLGELSSRNIRGTKMEDVIFGGTDDRRPMGFAEVSVTFDNTSPENRLDSEYDEVTVTRRYFRTGESEYLINKQPKRLKDIYMLFMNTGVGREGYSIIGQGKIAEIVSKKSEDRRTIFEEAAGISKYRHNKEESERKLKNTQENLDRVKDILSELEGRVVPLEKEAEKARRGLAIYEEKKRADVSLWLYDTKQIRVDIDEANKAAKLSRNELEIIDQIRQDLDAQQNELFNKTQSNRLASEDLMTKIRDTDNRKHMLDNKLRLAEQDFAHSAELVEQCRARIKELEASGAELESGKRDYQRQKTELEKKLAELSHERDLHLAEQQAYAYSVAKMDKELEEELTKLEREEASATDLKIRIDVLKSSKFSDKTKSFDIEKEIKSYEETGKSLKEEAERCDKNASGYRTRINEKEDIIKKASETVEALTSEREEENGQMNSFVLERDTLLHRADALQRMNDHFEGYGESVKFVMREYASGNISGRGKIYGPLSKLINVDKRYITAIETALGASLQNIVVDDEEMAKAAISALKRANAGRATFYPISAIRPMSETEEIRSAKKMQGFVGRADTLVVSDAKYRSIIEWLLLRTLVFEDIDSASRAAKQLAYKVKIVTIDGQVINAGGAFTGGSAKRDSGILSRTTEISTLREKAEKLGAEIDTLKKKIDGINSNLRTAQDELKDAEQERELLLTLSRSQFAALDNANAKYEANKNILEKLKLDYESLTTRQSEFESEIEKLEIEYRENLERVTSIKEHRASLSEERGVTDEKSDELLGKANTVFIKITEIRKDIETAERLAEDVDLRIASLESEKAAQNARIQDLLSKRDTIDSLKLESKKEYERLEKELENLYAERREVESGSDEFERELKSLQEKIKEKSSSRDAFYEAVIHNESKLEKLVEKQDKLGSQLWDDYEITYEDAIALDYPAVTEENRAEIAAVQSSCKSKLRSLGNYNPGAIEEYAEVKTRYDELNRQYTDLTNSYDELVNIIAQIEVEMRVSFTAAFDAINTNFGIVFKELFGGGHAELSLDMPEDVLKSGIEIKAAPPGKIIKSMSLLSGGEQAFVATALLFAILKVNPTPFCILDEIEAALDEVNVFRFGEYIKRLSTDTQFILITHRRGTMEIGDRLYGVTMPQRGISQAIELNVNEIEGKQRELLDGVL